MSALTQASLGVLCSNKGLGMATLGAVCDGAQDVRPPRPTWGGGPVAPDTWRVPAHIIEQDDSDIIAIIVAAIESGIIE